VVWFYATISGAEATGEGELSLGGGYDSNANRSLDGQGVRDEYLVGHGSLSGSWAPETLPWSMPTVLTGNYDLGAKHFFHESGEDLLAQQASGDASLRVSKTLNLGATVQGKDRQTRVGDRDYADFSGGLFAEGRIGLPVVGADLSAERFLYEPAGSYSFTGGRLELSSQATLEKRHRLHLELEGDLRGFNGLALNRDGTPQPELRHDWVWGGTLGYDYRGSFLAGIAYGLLSNRSNSFGQSFLRHRLQGNLAVFLPLHIVLTAQGALQLTRLPDGVVLAPELLLLEDNENTDQLAVKVSRSWESGFDVELKGETFRSDFTTNGLHYHRSLVQATVGYRF
jgi:hypothetical protein